MKKLMTMIAAAAMSFGLFADGAFVSGTGFDDLGTGTLNTTGDYWTEWTPGDGNFATVTAWEGSGETYTRAIGRPVIGGDQDTNFLNLKTTFGNPLYRNVTDKGEAYTLSGNLYYDSLVKFTACDEDPTATYTDAKIIVYTKEMTGNDGETVTGTNLFVKAGQITDGSAIYDCGDFSVYGDSDGWNRLTIKVIDKVYGNDPGFELFINGLAVTYVSGTTGYVVETLSSNGKILNTAKKLFPTMVAGDASITGVGFDGQGKVDDIAFTTLAPDFADDKYFTLQWDEHVASLKYTVNDGAEVTADVTPGVEGSVGLLYSAGMTVAVTATYGSTVQGETWAAGTWEKKSTDVTLNGTTFTVGAPDQWGKVVSQETTPRISVTIGEATTSYPTFAAMLNAIKTISTGTVKIQLADGYDFTLKDATENSIITAGAEVELDLNGQTITGPVGVELAAVMSSANLTIKDSVGTGKIELASGNTGAVYCIGKLTVQGGTFDGLVTATTSDIVAGKFAKASNPNFKTALTVNSGSELDETDQTYWIVTVAPTYTVTFKVDGVQYGDVQTIKKGGTATAPTTAPTKTGYTFKEWQLNEETFDFQTPINEDITLVAAFDENTYTIKFDGKGSTVEDVKVLYTALPKSLDGITSTKMNYDFGGWFLGDDEKKQIEFADFEGKTELTLVADFSVATTFTLTYNANDGEGEMDPVEFTIEDGLIPLTKNKFTKDGAKFTGWNTQADGKGTAYENEDMITLDPQTQLADIELFAQWEADAPDPVVPGEDITTDKTPAEINADPTLKAQLLKAPEGATVDPTVYNTYFDAVDGSEAGTVKFELNDAGKKAVADSIAEQINPAEGEPALDPAKIADGTQESMTVANPIAGFYYAIKQDAALNSMKVTACELATGAVGAAITFELNNGEASGFYEILCGPTAFEVENE